MEKSQNFTPLSSGTFNLCKRCELQDKSDTQDLDQIFLLEETLREKSIENDLSKKQIISLKTILGDLERNNNSQKIQCEKLFRGLQERVFTEKNL
jgi:chromosome segregation ATPase